MTNDFDSVLILLTTVTQSFAADSVAAAEKLVQSLRHSAPAARVIRRYSQQLPGYPPESLSQQAIEQLANWVEQGKP